MFFGYDATNWYWVVGSNESQVWSSKRLTYVPADDADYQTWKDAGYLATRIDTAENLWGVMSDQVVPTFYTTINLMSSGTPAINGAYSVNSAAQQSIVALSTGIAAGKPLPGGGQTFKYSDVTGARHDFSKDNFLNFANAVENYVYNVGDAIANSVAGQQTDLPSSTLNIA